MVEIGRLGFIGYGNMAKALIKGIVEASLVNVDNIIASKTKVTSTGLCSLTTSNVEVVEKSDIIIIAVKPGSIATVLAEINTSFGSEKLKGKCFISIAAGVSTEDLLNKMPSHNGTSFIRVMPNTPCSVGECAAAYTLGAYASPADKDICEAIFKSVGTISQVPEPMMDGVTGLSGSGPAYVFMFIEALADGAVRMGVPRDVALKLAAQTVKGAATMCLETGLHPGVLKDQVCSPGGTTIAGVEALEEHGFRAAAMSAVVAATKRCAELRAPSK